jgi:hypothetical protein
MMAVFGGVNRKSRMGYNVRSTLPNGYLARLTLSAKGARYRSKSAIRAIPTNQRRSEAPFWIDEGDFLPSLSSESFKLADSRARRKSQGHVFEQKVEISVAAPFAFAPEFLPIPESISTNAADHLLNKRSNSRE